MRKNAKKTGKRTYHYRGINFSLRRHSRGWWEFCVYIPNGGNETKSHYWSAYATNKRKALQGAKLNIDDFVSSIPF